MIKYSPLMIRIVLLLGLQCVGPIALAEEPKKPAAPLPARMTELDYARLDAATARIAAIMADTQAKLAPHGAVIKQICEKYKIDPADIDSGAVVISTAGDIVRRKKPEEPKKLPAPAPAPVKK